MLLVSSQVKSSGLANKLIQMHMEHYQPDNAVRGLNGSGSQHAGRKFSKEWIDSLVHDC